MADIIAVRKWTRIHCGAKNSHCRDVESFFALTTDGREISLSRYWFERLSGFIPATEGRSEVPGNQYGGDFSTMAGVNWSCSLQFIAHKLGQLGYSRVSEEVVGW